MRPFTLFITVLCFVAAFSAPVHANQDNTNYDRVHLSASANLQVENDTMTVSLYAESEGQKPAKLSEEVNAKVRWGLEQVKKYPVVKTQTSAYSTQPVYHENKIKAWRVRQTIRLESRDLVIMSDLLGELQQQLALQGVQFSVSPELKNKVDDQLIKQALTAFENRAKLVTSQLRRKDYRLVDINIATSNMPIMQRQLAMARIAMEAETSPAVSAGEQTIQVTVSGEVELE